MQADRRVGQAGRPPQRRGSRAQKYLPSQIHPKLAEVAFLRGLCQRGSLWVRSPVGPLSGFGFGSLRAFLCVLRASAVKCILETCKEFRAPRTIRSS